MVFLDVDTFSDDRKKSSMDKCTVNKNAGFVRAKPMTRRVSNFPLFPQH